LRPPAAHEDRWWFGDPRLAETKVPHPAGQVKGNCVSVWNNCGTSRGHQLVGVKDVVPPQHLVVTRATHTYLNGHDAVRPFSLIPAESCRIVVGSRIWGSPRF